MNRNEVLNLPEFLEVFVVVIKIKGYLVLPNALIFTMSSFIEFDVGPTLVKSFSTSSVCGENLSTYDFVNPEVSS